jgi:hypothetical protein
LRAPGIINPAAKYVVFSHREPAHGKASERRCSYSTASFDNAVHEQAHDDLAYLLTNRLGATDKHQPRVATFTNGITIGCKPRLDLTLISNSEHDILCRRVNEIG